MKCGFIYEGRKRNAKYKNGEFFDMLMYSILKPEFLGGAFELPAWTIQLASALKEIDFVINECDSAFGDPVSHRMIYPDLLKKIHSKGKFIFGYNGLPLGYCAFYANDSEKNTAFISLIAVAPEYQKCILVRNCCRNPLQ